MQEGGPGPAVRISNNRGMSGTANGGDGEDGGTMDGRCGLV